MIIDISTALAHARIARAARIQVAAAKAANDASEIDRWTRHEQANMRCFRMDLDDARGRSEKAV
jgi:hypothetical protein